MERFVLVFLALVTLSHCDKPCDLAKQYANTQNSVKVITTPLSSAQFAKECPPPPIQPTNPVLVSVSAQYFFDGYACGACLKVGGVTYSIMGQSSCVDCDVELIGGQPSSAGSGLQMEFVSCDMVSPIYATNMETQTLKIAIGNTRLPIWKLEYIDSNATPQKTYTLVGDGSGSFIDPAGSLSPPPFPMLIQVYTLSGDDVEIYLDSSTSPQEQFDQFSSATTAFQQGNGGVYTHTGCSLSSMGPSSGGGSPSAPSWGTPSPTTSGGWSPSAPTTTYPTQPAPYGVTPPSTLAPSSSAPSAPPPAVTPFKGTSFGWTTDKQSDIGTARTLCKNWNPTADLAWFESTQEVMDLQKALQDMDLQSVLDSTIAIGAQTTNTQDTTVKSEWKWLKSGDVVNGMLWQPRTPTADSTKIIVAVQLNFPVGILNIDPSAVTYRYLCRAAPNPMTANPYTKLDWEGCELGTIAYGSFATRSNRVPVVAPLGTLTYSAAATCKEHHPVTDPLAFCKTIWTDTEKTVNLKYVSPVELKPFATENCAESEQLAAQEHHLCCGKFQEPPPGKSYETGFLHFQFSNDTTPTWYPEFDKIERVVAEFFGLGANQVIALIGEYVPKQQQSTKAPGKVISQEFTSFNQTTNNNTTNITNNNINVNMNWWQLVMMLTQLQNGQLSQMLNQLPGGNLPASFTNTGLKTLVGNTTKAVAGKDHCVVPPISSATKVHASMNGVSGFTEITQGKKSIPEGAVLKYECNESEAYVTLQPKKMITMTCLNGDWSSQPLQCAKGCAWPTAGAHAEVKLANGMQESKYVAPKTTLNFQCDKLNYKMKANNFNSVTCLGDSKYSNPPMECEEVNAVPQADCVLGFYSVTNGVLSQSGTSIPHGQTVDVSCDKGYILSGGSINCQNGVWTTPNGNPKCTKPGVSVLTYKDLCSNTKCAGDVSDCKQEFCHVAYDRLGMVKQPGVAVHEDKKADKIYFLLSQWRSISEGMYTASTFNAPVRVLVQPISAGASGSYSTDLIFKSHNATHGLMDGFINSKTKDGVKDSAVLKILELHPSKSFVKLGGKAVVSTNFKFQTDLKKVVDQQLSNSKQGPSSAYSACSERGYIVLDLGALYQVETIQVYEEVKGYYCGKMLEYSQDGIHWVTVFDKGPAFDDNPSYVMAKVAQWIRYWTSKRDTSTVVRIHEIDIMGWPLPPLSTNFDARCELQTKLLGDKCKTTTGNDGLCDSSHTCSVSTKCASIQCPVPSPCEPYQCDPADGQCYKVSLPDGTQCQAGKVQGTCKAKLCVPTSSPTVTPSTVSFPSSVPAGPSPTSPPPSTCGPLPSDQCTNYKCVSGKWEKASPKGDGTYCSDGSSMTSYDTCVSGYCVGLDIDGTPAYTSESIRDKCNAAYICRSSTFSNIPTYISTSHATTYKKVGCQSRMMKCIHQKFDAKMASFYCYHVQKRFPKWSFTCRSEADITSSGTVYQGYCPVDTQYQYNKIGSTINNTTRKFNPQLFGSLKNQLEQAQNAASNTLNSASTSATDLANQAGTLDPSKAADLLKNMDPSKLADLAKNMGIDPSQLDPSKMADLAKSMGIDPAKVADMANNMGLDPSKMADLVKNNIDPSKLADLSKNLQNLGIDPSKLGQLASQVDPAAMTNLLNKADPSKLKDIKNDLTSLGADPSKITDLMKAMPDIDKMTSSLNNLDKLKAKAPELSGITDPKALAQKLSNIANTSPDDLYKMLDKAGIPKADAADMMTAANALGYPSTLGSPNAPPPGTPLSVGASGGKAGDKVILYCGEGKKEDKTFAPHYVCDVDMGLWVPSSAVVAAYPSQPICTGSTGGPPLPPVSTQCQTQMIKCSTQARSSGCMSRNNAQCVCAEMIWECIASYKTSYCKADYNYDTCIKMVDPQYACPAERARCNQMEKCQTNNDCKNGGYCRLNKCQCRNGWSGPQCTSRGSTGGTAYRRPMWPLAVGGGLVAFMIMFGLVILCKKPKRAAAAAPLAAAPAAIVAINPLDTGRGLDDYDQSGYEYEDYDDYEDEEGDYDEEDNSASGSNDGYASGKSESQ